MLGDPIYRDYHLLRIVITPDCKDEEPIETFLPTPNSWNNTQDCYYFAAELPDGINIGVDIEYIEACNDCYNNTRGACGDYYRTTFISNTAVKADASNPNNNYSVVPLKFVGAYCSDSDNCESNIYKDAILIN